MLRKKEKAHKQEEKEEYNSLLVLLVALTLILTSSINTLAQENTESQLEDIETINKKIQDAKDKEIASKLESLEEKVFHQKYKTDSNEDRINRLEEFVFGQKYLISPPEVRLKNLTSALNLEEEKPKAQEPQETIKAEPLASGTAELTEDKPRIEYDESTESGVFGAVSKIEMKIFHKTFNEIPFYKRVEKLEDEILTTREKNTSKKRPLIERVSILVKRIGIEVPEQIPIQAPENQVTKPSGPQSYFVDPNTGYLINEQTKEVVIDGSGNPIKVRVPKILHQQTIPQDNNNYRGNWQQNPFPQNAPYGNFPLQPGMLPGQYFPGQPFPYDPEGVYPQGQDPNY